MGPGRGPRQVSGRRPTGRTGAGRGDPPSQEEVCPRAGPATRLTESSFHVIGRTALGIPDQLSFRNSSVGKKEREDRVYTPLANVPSASAPPINIIGAASRRRLRKTPA